VIVASIQLSTYLQSGPRPVATIDLSPLQLLAETPPSSWTEFAYQITYIVCGPKGPTEAENLSQSRKRRVPEERCQVEPCLFYLSRFTYNLSPSSFLRFG
jgi:hypothetical protein